MDPTAFSLASGILVFVLSYSCFGIALAFSLPIALVTTVTVWTAQQVSRQWEHSTGLDSRREETTTVWRNRTPSAKSLEPSKT
jgi:hypothetical protein